MTRPNHLPPSLRTLILLLILAPALPGCGGSPSEPEEKGPPWRTYRRPATPALLDNKINSISVDEFNRVWIATDSGANYYHRGAWSVIDRQYLRYETFTQMGTVVSYKVNTIEMGSYGTVWFGLEGGGVLRWRENATTDIWTLYKTSTTPGLVSNFIKSITGDRITSTGDVWFTTLSGISRFRPLPSDVRFGTWTEYSSPPLTTLLVRASALKEDDQIMWFGTDDGLMYYNDFSMQWRSLELSPPNDYRINDIAIDADGIIWMAKLVGVSSFDGRQSTWAHYTNDSTAGGLPVGEVHAVAAQGTTKWFGTDHGLVRFQGSTWTTFTTAQVPELPSDVITTLAVDRRGNLWIGTPEGIAEFNEGGIVN